MKKITVFIGASALALNVIFLLILSNYELFNFVLSSVAIVMAAGLISLSSNISPNDGFKIGLAFFFSISFLIKLVLAFLSNQNIKDNPLLILFVCISFFEIIVLFIPSLVNKK